MIPAQDAPDDLRREDDRAATLAEIERQDLIQRRQSATSNTQQITIGDIIVCRDCRNPIDSRRLAVVPNAERCCECQKIVESVKDGN